MRSTLRSRTTRYRSIFISDLHLGSPHCHAAELAAFLSNHASEKLYLVGDVFDLEWLKTRKSGWNFEHTRVLDVMQEKMREGLEIIYIPGNHDAPLRRFCGMILPGVVMRRRLIHTSANGQRLLVTHGDEYDSQVRFGGASEWLGEWLYERLLTCNRWSNKVRTRFGARYFSLASFLKRQSNAAERYIARFRAAVILDVKKRGLDGVVCGHIHRPELLQIDGLIYANDGDWVESLSALVEAHDGTLSLLHYAGEAAVISELPSQKKLEIAA